MGKYMNRPESESLTVSRCGMDDDIRECQMSKYVPTCRGISGVVNMDIGYHVIHHIDYKSSRVQIFKITNESQRQKNILQQSQPQFQFSYVLHF